MRGGKQHRRSQRMRTRGNSRKWRNWRGIRRGGGGGGLIKRRGCSIEREGCFIEGGVQLKWRRRRGVSVQRRRVFY